MFDLATLGTFIAVVLGLFLVPGPAVLLVLTRTAQGGRRNGILTGLGIAAGDFLHTLFAACGLSALLMTSALAFTVVKLAGAAYLFYLGVRALLARADADPARPAARPVKRVTSAQAFWQAIPAELLNPKTALFFLAFLPQFVYPAGGSPFIQFAVLGAIFVVLSALYTTLIACAALPLGRLVGRLGWLRRWQQKLVGVIFIALGLKVAAQAR
jgi:threonine/homoserine/homoserine lactone efflux protein